MRELEAYHNLRPLRSTHRRPYLRRMLRVHPYPPTPARRPGELDVDTDVVDSKAPTSKGPVAMMRLLITAVALLVLVTGCVSTLTWTIKQLPTGGTG